MNFEDLLQQHLNSIDLDIRKKPAGYYRYMDQKVTPDVLSFIADCIINFIGGKDPHTIFVIKDLWKFQYFQKNTVAVFSKPSPTNESAQSEYDKFIAQPIKTLTFAKILKEEKISNKNIYQIIQLELLEHVARNERAAWIFLAKYIEKVLSDSGFIDNLELYKEKSLNGNINQGDYEELKTKFESFMIGYTNIKGKTEIRRIFPKVLNPYASYYMINGSEKGKMTESKFTYSDLMYNRENFRDLGKDKSITRQEAEQIIIENPELVTYKVQKAKNIIKRNYISSELHDSLAVGEATQIHHIFPTSEYPEISAYLENLILLTPQQHNTKAHPNNHTGSIDKNYQKECLLAKINSIENSLNQGKDLYTKESLIHVINIGAGLDLSTNTSFEELKNLINHTNF